jgi:hypothetical protein
VEYGIDHDLINMDLKENGVRKSPHKRAAVVFVDDWINKRVPLDGQDGDFNAPKKVHSKPLGLFFVPCIRIGNVLPGFWKENQSIRHVAPRRIA